MQSNAHDLEVTDVESFFDVDSPTGPSPYLVLAIVAVLALVFFAWGNEYHILNINFGIGPVALVLSVATGAALWLYLVKRDGMPSMRVFGLGREGTELGFSVVLFFLFPVMVCFYGYPGAFRVANCLFDTSETKARVVKVVSVLGQRNRMEAGKRIWVSAREGSETDLLPLPRSKSGLIEKGARLSVTTRSGLFGQEWVTTVEPAPRS